MADPKKSNRVDQTAQEELESTSPFEDDVADLDKYLRTLQSGIGELVKRLEIAAIKAATLTAPEPPYPGAEALGPALEAAQKCRNDLAAAQTGLAAAEEQWQVQRS